MTTIAGPQPSRITSLAADTHKVTFVADMWSTTLTTLSSRAPTLLRAVTDEVARAVARRSGTEVTVPLHADSGYLGRIVIDGAHDKVSLWIHTVLRGDGTYSTPASSFETSGSEQALALALAGPAGAGFEKAFGARPSGMRIVAHENKTDKTLVLELQVPGIGAALRGADTPKRTSSPATTPATATVAPKQPVTVATPNAQRAPPDPNVLAAGICDFSSLARADAAMRKVLDGIPRGHLREDYRVAYRAAVARTLHAAPLPEAQKLDLLEINARVRAEGG